MALLRDFQAETVHIIPHSILDQITEIITVTLTTVIAHTTDRVTTETTTGTEDTNKTQDMTKETRISKTGMITTRIETGLTTEDDQINTNITETSQEHKSSSNTRIRIY